MESPTHNLPHRVVILGGSNCFALALAKRLLQEPEVEILSISRRRWAQIPRPFTEWTGILHPATVRFQHTALHLTYQFIELERVLRDFEPQVIINFAAQGESATSFSESWRYFETNCVGLSRLVEALEKWPKPPDFFHISSSEVYGPAFNFPCAEGVSLHPSSPYAISKAAFDQYLIEKINRGFPGVIIRPSNCYGEGQQLHRLIPKAFLFGMTGRRLPLHNGGLAEKSYLHADDLASALLLLLSTSLTFSTINVGPEKPTSIHDLAIRIAHTLGGEIEDFFDVTSPERDHQDSRYWIDSARLRALGWAPHVAFQEGLPRVARWVEENLDTLAKLPSDFIMRA